MINKPISTDLMLQTAHEVFSRGWTTIKMYFMIGHPTQTLEDVEAIAQLAHEVLACGPPLRRAQSQGAGRRLHACAQAANPLPVGADGGRGHASERIGSISANACVPHGLQLSTSDVHESLMESVPQPRRPQAGRR